MALIFNVKDIDNRWWTFAQQQKKMSCGPTAVKIAKGLAFNRQIGEKIIRGLVMFQYSGKSNTGVSLIQSANQSDHEWDTLGSAEKKILTAMKANPCSFKNARFVKGLDPLRKASRNYPAILSFNWATGGGHFVVCVGPTKSDNKKFIILDPSLGLKYLSENDVNGLVIKYKPSNTNLIGTIDNGGYIITH